MQEAPFRQLLRKNGASNNSWVFVRMPFVNFHADGRWRLVGVAGRRRLRSDGDVGWGAMGRAEDVGLRLRLAFEQVEQLLAFADAGPLVGAVHERETSS